MYTSTANAKTDDYEAFCEGFRRLCGIDLGQYKRGQMERRIRTFTERRGTSDLVEYLKLLKQDDELNAFLDRVTINVSQLWRNPEQWTRLQRDIIPELTKDQRTFTSWSAGASYGAEAYTLAAIAHEATQPGTRIVVDGTDIDKRVVARAKRGHFTNEDARDAPKPLLTKWFDKDEHGWQAKQELIRVTNFQQGDLLRTTARPGKYDLVLCRNTVIYFTDDVRDALHARLAESVRPGGYFMVGSTERVAQPAALGLEPAYPFTYRKTT